MKYNTSTDLIEKQKEFWNEDLALPGDSISSEIEYLNLNELNYDEKIMESYTNKNNIEVQSNLNYLIECIKKGVHLPPILIDKTHLVLDGYHRVLACKELKINSIPTIKLNRKSNI